MKIIALNSSPRKNWNTSMVLQKALEGAASVGAETEFIQLNDLNYKGCQSCFACKKKNGKSYGKCAYSDDLSPVLKRIEAADAIILGSPIYFGEVPGMMRNLMERLIFPRYEYTKSPLLNPRKIRNAHIYTMNVNDETMTNWLKPKFDSIQGMFNRIIGPAETFTVTSTLQWNDYSKYVTDGSDEAEKKQARKEKYPKDLDAAFQLGKRLAS